MPAPRTWPATLLIAVLSAAGITAAGTFLYLQHSLAGSLEQALSERMGTDSQVGIAYLGLFPAGLYLSSVSVRNPEGFNDRYFLKVDSLKLEVGHYARKKRLVTAPRMNINGLKVWVEYHGRRSNEDVIKRNLANYHRKQGNTRADKTKFIIDELRIRDIRTQLRAGSDDTTTELPDLVLRNVGKARNGITLGELADLVTRAVLREVVKQDFRRELDQRFDKEIRDFKQKLKERFD